MARFSFSPPLFPLLLCGVLAVSLAQHSFAQTAAATSLRIAPEAQVINASTTLQSAQAPEAALTADPGSIPNRLKANAVTSGPRPNSAFPSANVGQISSSYITFTTTFSASTTVTGNGVYTLGAAGSDFQDVGTGTCDTNGYPYTYAASSTCTTTVSFTPSKPGNRMGAEVLYTSTAGSYFYGYLNGIGNGPQVTFAPATPALSTIASGLSAYNSALDGAGNLWVTDSAAGAVKEFVATGGVYPTSPTNTYTGFTTPQGIAIDGVGSVYVGDGPNGTLWRLSATNGVVPPGTVPVAYVSFLTPGTQPIYVALDPTQTYLWFTGIYSGSNYLLRCTISSGSCALGTTFTAPSGLAFDSAGYKYVSDSSAKTVTRMPVGTSVTKTTVLSGLTNPVGLTADAAGDLFLADQGAGTSGTGTITEYLATSGLVSTTSGTITQATGLYAPSGVTVDSSGNIYIADTSNNALKELSLSTPPALSFANTAVGSTSSSQTVTLQNIGNAALNFISTTNYAGFPLSNTCPAQLAYGATCTFSIAYRPTVSGSVAQTLTITDNNLNVANATQSIRLTGSTGGLTISVVGATAAKGSTAVPLEVTVGYGGNTAPTGTPAITINGSAAGVGAVACTTKLGHLNCTSTYDASSLTPGNYTITATQPASGPYSATSATAILSIIGSSLRTPSPINTLSPAGPLTPAKPSVSTPQTAAPSRTTSLARSASL